MSRNGRSVSLLSLLSVALSINDGSEIWSFEMNGAGVSAPLLYREQNIEGDDWDLKRLVIVGSNDRSIYAVHQKNGTLLWRRDVYARVQATPVFGLAETLDRKRSNPTTTLAVIVATERGHVFALSPLSGDILWETDLGAPVRSSPAVTQMKDVAYFGAGDKLVILSLAHGTVLKYHNLQSGEIHASPLLVEWGAQEVSEPILFVGTMNGQFIAFALNSPGGDHSPRKIWAVDMERPIDFQSRPTVCGSMVLVSGYFCELRALNISNGDQVWAFTDATDVVAGPAVSADETTLYVGSSNQKLYALKAKDGALIWMQDFGYAIQSTPVVAADGSVVVTGTLPKHRKQRFRQPRVGAYTSAGRKLWESEVNAMVFGPAVLAEEPDDCSVYLSDTDSQVYRIGRCPEIHDEL